MIGRLSVLVLVALVVATAVEANRRDEDPYQDQNEVDSRSNIGPDFPYRRGETPIFNFDQGDEKFLETIPQLVKSLYHLADLTGRQKGVAKSFGDAIKSCQDCQH